MKIFFSIILSLAVFLTAASCLLLSKRVENLRHELTLLTTNVLDLSDTHVKDKTEIENQVKELDVRVVKLESAKIPEVKKDNKLKR